MRHQASAQPARVGTRQAGWSALLAVMLAVAASAGSAAASVDRSAPLRVVFAAWQLAAERLAAPADGDPTPDTLGGLIPPRMVAAARLPWVDERTPSVMLIDLPPPAAR